MAVAFLPAERWRRLPTQPTPLAAAWSRITGVWYPHGPAIPGQGNDRDPLTTLSGGAFGRAVRSADNGFFNGHGPIWTGAQPTVTSVGGWSVLVVYRHVSNGWGQGGLVRTSSRHGLGITAGVPTIYYDNTPRHTSAIAASSSVPSVIVARMMQGGTDEIYVDGALGVSAANGGYNYIGTLTRMGSGFGFGHTVGDFFLALSMPWYLSVAEIEALSADPLQVFRPQPRRTYLLAGGGGGDPTATLAGTLAALTLSAEAEIAAGPTATLAGTLAALTLSAEASASSGVGATLAGTLGALTLSSEADIAAGPTATLAGTLGALTLSAEATTLGGTLATLGGTLGVLTLAAEAQTAAGPAATLAATLGALTLAATAEVTEFEPSGDTEAALSGTLGALVLVAHAAVAGPDPTLPRTRRIGRASLVGAARSTVTLRGARRIGRTTLERIAA
jgi:hypothetical protein